jgi:hypothetical protein
VRLATGAPRRLTPTDARPRPPRGRGKDIRRIGAAFSDPDRLHDEKEPTDYCILKLMESITQKGPMAAEGAALGMILKDGASWESLVLMCQHSPCGCRLNSARSRSGCNARAVQCYGCAGSQPVQHPPHSPSGWTQELAAERARAHRAIHRANRQQTSEPTSRGHAGP